VRLGRRLGGVLAAGDVVGLAGELGSGKTWFTKGVALGLGVPPETVVTSPSFSLVNEYDGRCRLYHMDAYRLGSLSDFLGAGLDEYLDRDGVVVMEWADRWPEILPQHAVRVKITISGEQTRDIVFSAAHSRGREILHHMRRDH